MGVYNSIISTIHTMSVCYEPSDCPLLQVQIQVYCDWYGRGKPNKQLFLLHPIYQNCCLVLQKICQTTIVFMVIHNPGCWHAGDQGRHCKSCSSNLCHTWMLLTTRCTPSGIIYLSVTEAGHLSLLFLGCSLITLHYLIMDLCRYSWSCHLFNQ